MSRLLRRSGIAVGYEAFRLGYRPQTMVQIGVGIHYQEVDVLKIEWGEGFQVIGYEPNPSVVFDIEKDYPGTLHPYGLSNRDGKATLYYRPNHKNGGSLYPLHGDSPQKVEVEVRRLDAHPPALADPNDQDVLLWADCEGSELDAFKGAEQFIADHVGVINVEMAGRPLGDNWCGMVETDAWLKEHGFYGQWIHTQRDSHAQCDYVYVRERWFKPEYCCRPEEVVRWEAAQQ